jgi:hypothetical protein
LQQSDGWSEGDAGAEILEGVVSVAEAVRSELNGFPDDLAQSALAATALAMAELVDDRSHSATSRSMCAGKLMDALEQLRALAPPKQERDDVDDLKARRAERRARSAGA